jgi:hypothetical protein
MKVQLKLASLVAMLALLTAWSPSGAAAAPREDCPTTVFEYCSDAWAQATSACQGEPLCECLTGCDMDNCMNGFGCPTAFCNVVEECYD